MWEFYENEPAVSCREMIEDNINEVRYLAANEAVTRRFFLIFQYEARMKTRANTVEAIAERLRDEEQTARRYLDMCGLEVRDEWGKTTEQNGTYVRFTPDETVFGEYAFNMEYLEAMVKNYTYLNTGLTVKLNGEAYCSKNGLLDLLRVYLRLDLLNSPKHTTDVRNGYSGRAKIAHAGCSSLLVLRKRMDVISSRFFCSMPNSSLLSRSTSFSTCFSINWTLRCFSTRTTFVSSICCLQDASSCLPESSVRSIASMLWRSNHICCGDITASRPAQKSSSARSRSFCTASSRCNSLDSSRI